MDSTTSASLLTQQNNQIFNTLLLPAFTIFFSWLGSYVIARGQRNHERQMESYRLYVIEKQKIYNLFWQKLLDVWGEIVVVKPEDAPTYYQLIAKARNEFFRNQLFFSTSVYKDCDDVLKEMLELKEIQTDSAETIGDSSTKAKQTREQNRKKFHESRKKINKLIEEIGAYMRKELSAGYDYFQLKK